MPAMLDDPLSPPIIRPTSPLSHLTLAIPSAPNIYPRKVTLRDRITPATLLPFFSPAYIPPSLLAHLSDQLNREIEKGDTYPMTTPMTVDAFGQYWFGYFGAVMLLEGWDSIGQVEEQIRIEGGAANVDGGWGRYCLGSFYVKPNYPGRSSHVCNGGFLVTDAARNKGVGRLMGEGYLEWAPKLGYSYSVFNLVYETNVASCRIWDALGFKRIGRVPRCGVLRSHPEELIDAIIYGRDLGPEGEDFVSEERFDKIRFYLKHGKYPNGADRAEKSRLRSAATHYKLLPASEGSIGTDGDSGERLMLKDKEVVADPQRQYEIARRVHAQAHGGINKTTAMIAEKYHWVRIKETVSLVIKNCADCKETGKVPTVRPEDGSGRYIPNSGSSGSYGMRQSNSDGLGGSSMVYGSGHHHHSDPNREIERLVSFDDAVMARGHQLLVSATPSSGRHQMTHSNNIMDDSAVRIRAPVATMRAYEDMPLDPQIMDDVQHTHRHHHHHHHHQQHGQHMGFHSHQDHAHQGAERLERDLMDVGFGADPSSQGVP